MRPKPNATRKELRSLLSTLSVIRILNYVSQTSMFNTDLSKRLSACGAAIDGPSLNRTLVKLRRHGWLRTSNSLHSLTPAGREALKLAVSGLKDLAALADRLP